MGHFREYFCYERENNGHFQGYCAISDTACNTSTPPPPLPHSLSLSVVQAPPSHSPPTQPQRQVSSRAPWWDLHHHSTSIFLA